jgi:uncharacterized protein YndB with AHSA1/START domain
MPIDGVVVKRTFKARRERVFAAWTKPELMARWFFPDASWSVDVQAELAPGGKYSLRMRDPSGAEHLQFGCYREIVPVSRLVFTWSCPDLGVEDSVVTVSLTARGESTELELLHELPPDPQVRKEHEGGWLGCLASLERVLSDLE